MELLKTCVRWSALPGAVILVMLSSAPNVRTQGSGDLPMRWSNWLKLRSLADIPAAMKAGVDNGGQFELGMGGSPPTIWPISCNDYLAAIDKGFYAVSTRDDKMEGPFVDRCYTLRYLQQARPAQRSHLTDPIWSADPLRALPPLCFRFERMSEEQVEDATAKGMSWQAFDPEARVTARDAEGLAVEDAGLRYGLSVMARADFDGDGVEDVALTQTIGAKGGTFDTTIFYILTRLSPGGPMKLLTRRTPPFRLAAAPVAVTEGIAAPVPAIPCGRSRCRATTAARRSRWPTPR
jgi:hypothetical protein